MYAIMDMGTTNTRLYMCTNNKVIDFVKGSFGANFGKKNGRQELCNRVESLLKELLNKCATNESDVETIVALGMAGSEIGLLDVPHISLPADAGTTLCTIDTLEVRFLSEVLYTVPYRGSHSGTEM